VLAVILIVVSLAYFNNLIDKNLQISFVGSAFLGLGGLVIFVGLLAGIYPAFVLSSFRPLKVLKGNLTSHAGGKGIRSGLIVFQFCISIALVIGTVVMRQQMKFISEKNLGYDKEQLLVLEGDFHMKPKLTRTLVAEFKRMPSIVSAAGSLSMPSIGGTYPQQYRSDASPDIWTMRTMYGGDQFAEVMGFELLNGKFFSDTTNDSLSAIINESALKMMGLKDPIGKKITFIEQTYASGEETSFTIVGVIKDFHFETLHKEIRPLVIQSNEIIYSRMSYIVARIKPGSNVEAIAQLEAKWKELVPGSPFQLRFVDTVLDNLYQKEQRTGKIFTLFTGLSIVVACIGLLGLSAFTVSLRAKEIGIRKIVGADVRDVLILLSKDFTWMILIAFALAAPMAWYVMEVWWLQGFAFRISISGWSIVLSGLAVMLMAWLTIGYQAIQAALHNPVDSLKHE
jgi:putative ABC transport system permease protein